MVGTCQETAWKSKLLPLHLGWPAIWTPKGKKILKKKRKLSENAKNTYFDPTQFGREMLRLLSEKAKETRERKRKRVGTWKLKKGYQLMRIWERRISEHVTNLWHIKGEKRNKREAHTTWLEDLCSSERKSSVREENVCRGEWTQGRPQTSSH